MKTPRMMAPPAEAEDGGDAPSNPGRKREVDPGVAANRAGDWTAAADIWGARALRRPEDARAHANYIRALLRLDRQTEAVVAVDFARTHHPGHEDFLHRQIWLLDRNGMDPQLRRLFAEPATAAQIRNAPRTALLAGRACSRMNAWRQAASFLGAAADDAETGLRANIFLGRQAYREGRFADAQRHWQAVIDWPEDAPRPEEPHLFLGRIAWRQGQPETAQTHFDEARRIAPECGSQIDEWLPDRPAPAPEPSRDIAAEEGPHPTVPEMEPEPAAPEPAQDTEPAEPEPLPPEPERLTGSDAAEARRLFDEGNHAEALELAMALLAEDDDDIGAAEVAGFAANRVQDWPAAAKAWGRLAELQPGRVGPMLQAASAREMMGDREAASALAKRVLELEPRNEAALVLAARQHARSNDADRLASFASTVAGFPDAALPERLITTLADGFMSLGRREEARFWVERGLGAHEGSQHIQLRRARLLYAERDFAGAAESWHGLLDAPGTVVRPFEPHVFLARCAAQENDFATAARHYESALQLNPQHQDTLENLVIALMRNGDLRRADAECARLRQQAPQHVRAWATHVLLAYRTGDEEAVAARYDETMKAIGDDPAALLQIGRTIESQRDDDRALAHWRQACGRFPDDPELRYRLVVQMFNMDMDGHTTLAEAEHLLLSAPDHEGGLFYLATLRHRLGQPELAGEAFRRGMELYPSNTGFWIGHAAQLMTADKVGEARQLLDQARAFADEEDPSALADLARLAEVVDLPDQAEDLFDRAIGKAPEDVGLWRRAIRFESNRGAYGRAWERAVEARKLSRADPMIVGTLVNASSLLSCTFPDWRGEPDERFRGALFPDDVFARIAERPWPRPADETGRRGAMIVTSTLGSGGSERQVMFSMEALRRVDHGYDDIHLVARSLNPHHRHDFFLPLVEESGFPVIDMGWHDPMELIRDLGEKAIPHREAIRIAAAMPPEVQAMALPLLAIFLKHRPEVVHLWQDTVNIAGGLAALLAGVPRIVMGTRSTRPDARRRMRRYLEPGYAAMLALPQVEMVNNSRNGARDYEDWLGLAAGSVGVIHNGFDVEKIRQSAASVSQGTIREQLGISDEALVLGGVMRFSEEKRPGLFVEAAILLAHRLPEAHFLLIGDGPLRPELIEGVARAGLSERIHLPGAKRPIEPWMREMSVLVLTSRMEGLPNVLIEAQILGVPVAATQVGGVPETMIPGETGIMVDSGEAGALADALEALVSDRSKLDLMGLAATEWAERSFSLEGMIRTTLDHYRVR
ncbi:MAG: glycosyltransferase [Minwuia sp.]|uniref:glycosyltransferase n=1 Tax=Minwuia sp. TaxID=2493630 RepID=UPI003A8587B0